MVFTAQYYCELSDSGRQRIIFKSLSVSIQAVFASPLRYLHSSLFLSSQGSSSAPNRLPRRVLNSMLSSIPLLQELLFILFQPSLQHFVTPTILISQPNGSSGNTLYLWRTIRIWISSVNYETHAIPYFSWSDRPAFMLLLTP